MGKVKTHGAFAIKFSFLLLFCVIFSNFALSEPSPEEVNKLTQEIGEETMSPFCPGRTLQACPSEDARQLKLQVTSLLSLGYSKDAVKRKLLTMYGENISGLPANNSFKDIAWLSPALFGLIGLVIVYFGLRIMKKNTDATGPKQDRANINLSEIEKTLRK